MVDNGEDAGECNFTIRQGQGWTRHIYWEAGSPPAEINTAAYTAVMTVRRRADDPDAIVELTNANGRIILGLLGTVLAGDRRNVTLTLDGATTAALPAGHYVYDLFLTPAGGEPDPLLAGRFTVKDSVSL